MSRTSDSRKQRAGVSGSSRSTAQSAPRLQSPDTFESLGPAPLDTHIVGSRVILMEEADSTSNVALRVGGDGTVVVADRQTAGRGRHGRSWHSAGGLGLWFSVAFERPVDGIAFATPLAIRKALQPFCSLDVKWPNDLLLHGKKLCGILVEHRNRMTALGVGLNVLHRAEDFPEELRDRASSLAAETGRTFARGDLLRAILTELDETVIVLREGGLEPLRQAWVAACNVIGRLVSHGAITGRVKHVDQSGALFVETPDGLRRIMFGEGVEVRG
jgi:BirA family transcriptional regulator, biotin operon repressor / biotin---[acetyl-CoA-carboxylase] ligase